MLQPSAPTTASCCSSLIPRHSWYRRSRARSSDVTSPVANTYATYSLYVRVFRAAARSRLDDRLDLRRPDVVRW